jgi:hypothetical protein
MPKAKRQKNLSNLAKNVHACSLVAGEMLVYDKAALVEMVDKERDVFRPAALMELEDAIGHAETLLEVLKAGRARLAVALAVVEGGQHGR